MSSSNRPLRMCSACTQCHAAKVRCSGEKTGCNRCRQMGVDCVYKVSMVGRMSRHNSDRHHRGSSFSGQISSLSGPSVPSTGTTSFLSMAATAAAPTMSNGGRVTDATIVASGISTSRPSMVQSSSPIKNSHTHAPQQPHNRPEGDHGNSISSTSGPTVPFEPTSPSAHRSGSEEHAKNASVDSQPNSMGTTALATTTQPLSPTSALFANHEVSSTDTSSGLTDLSVDLLDWDWEPRVSPSEESSQFRSEFMMAVGANASNISNVGGVTATHDHHHLEASYEKNVRTLGTNSAATITNMCQGSVPMEVEENEQQHHMYYHSYDKDHTIGGRNPCEPPPCKPPIQQRTEPKSVSTFDHLSTFLVSDLGGTTQDVSHLIGLAKLVRVLEAYTHSIASSPYSPDEIMKVNRMCMADMATYVKVVRPSGCRTCSLLITCALDLILTLFEHIVQSFGSYWDRAPDPAAVSGSPFSGLTRSADGQETQNPHFQELRIDRSAAGRDRGNSTASVQLPPLQFGVFELDEEEQVSFARRILNKELQRFRHITESFSSKSVSVAPGPVNKVLIEWSESMKERIMRLSSLLGP